MIRAVLDTNIIISALLLECAQAARADYLVTGNLKHFPTSWTETRIVTARWLLDRSQTLQNKGLRQPAAKRGRRGRRSLVCGMSLNTLPQPKIMPPDVVYRKGPFAVEQASIRACLLSLLRAIPTARKCVSTVLA